MNRKMDPMGRAILDYVKRQGRAAEYWKTKTADRLRVFSPMFAEDEIPLTTLFRSYEDMPESDISYVFEDERLRVGASAGMGDGNREALATDRDARTSGMEGMIDIPNEMDYYSEHSFQMQYKDTIGEAFDWLYIDADTLKQKAERCGYEVELVAEGEHYDYLARITKK